MTVSKPILLDEHWHVPGGKSSMLDDLMRKSRKQDVRFLLSEEEEEYLLAQAEGLNSILQRLRDYREQKERETEKALARWEGEGGNYS